MNRNFFSIEELKQGAYNLLHFRDELKKRNIDFIFMVCPYSANIMVNMYPKYIKHIEYNSTDQFISYISKNTDLKIVYPKKQLLEYKDKYQLYYKYDHHWNNIGAYVGFKVLSDKLSMNLDKLSDLNVLSFDVSYRKYWVLNNNYDFYNTSVRTMNLHNLKYFRDDPIYYIEKYHIKTNYYFLEGRKHFHSPSITRSAVASNDYNVFFIDDSYAYGMFDYIATEFYKASFRHREEFKVEEIIKYDPNIVVFELVEGNLKKSVLDIIPNYKIEKINKNLETNSVVSNN
ncbi:alginate O-acetyltransferase AlgX-related protein [Brachyspira hyodysenteriae]|nr:hypothetical protein [Brachyspira hyodysenteriae]AUJ49281.1 hypothetical protein BH718_00831 [Brachyspira hyodysenteriae]